MKRLVVILGVAGLMTFQAAFGSCSDDKGQMDAQISQYGSIVTAGCPPNSGQWGVSKISQVVERSDKKCSATCFYALGAGSKGQLCDWESGKWGNTLACH